MRLSRFKSGLAVILLAPASLFSKSSLASQASDFSKDDDRTLVARIVFGEARNCPYEERVAVAYSILTRRDDRLPYNGEGSIRNVVFYPYGYSCLSNKKWNKENLMTIKDPMRYDPENWRISKEIANGVLDGKLKNPVPGANLYDLRGCNPKWLKSPNVKRLPTPKNFKHIWCKENRR